MGQRRDVGQVGDDLSAQTSQKAEEHLSAQCRGQKTRETKGKLSSASVMTRITTSDDVRRR